MNGGYGLVRVFQEVIVSLWPKEAENLKEIEEIFNE